VSPDSAGKLREHVEMGVLLGKRMKWLNRNVCGVEGENLHQKGRRRPARRKTNQRVGRDRRQSKTNRRHNLTRGKGGGLARSHVFIRPMGSVVPREGVRLKGEETRSTQGLKGREGMKKELRNLSKSR